jgi:signal transduction histidine kinase
LVLRITHDEKSGFVDLTVRDSGCGIPRDQLPKIFDRFYTTKSGPDATGKGGTGVGLSACREIVDAHQGRLRVESSVGKGTAFTVRLPAWQQKSESAAATPIAPLGVPNSLTSSTSPTSLGN